jgi:hypothetical protein
MISALVQKMIKIHPNLENLHQFCILHILSFYIGFTGGKRQYEWKNLPKFSKMCKLLFCPGAKGGQNISFTLSQDLLRIYQF